MSLAGWLDNYHNPDTIPQINIDPAKQGSEDLFPLKLGYFQGLCWYGYPQYIYIYIHILVRTPEILPSITQVGEIFIIDPIIKPHYCGWIHNKPPIWTVYTTYILMVIWGMVCYCFTSITINCAPNIWKAPKSYPNLLGLHHLLSFSRLLDQGNSRSNKATKPTEYPLVI